MAREGTFRHAIVRPPGANFAEGLTTAGLGAPIHAQALEQHEGYCRALERCGLAVTRLDADPDHPDSTFVEDTAVLTGHSAILTRPGAASRRGEVRSIRDALERCFASLQEIQPPDTVDGGDVCEADGHFFIGISQRTNEEGARQLAALLEAERYTAEAVDIREVPGILHLKSGIAYLGDRRLAVIEALAARAAFRLYDCVRVDADEGYAANCIRINDFVVLPAGYPKFQNALARLGYRVIPAEASEFRKMDGGLSCLSLRF